MQSCENLWTNGGDIQSIHTDHGSPSVSYKLPGIAAYAYQHTRMCMCEALCWPACCHPLRVTFPHKAGAGVAPEGYHIR